ncbi:MAG: site-2 protease family protein [Planctomycetes bacterium]|nr:site-2 protease family protein [Planctomycetota bacterium]
MDTLVTILQSVFGFGFLIFIHELGHFLAARWCGVDCYVFSLGYGPRLAGFVRNGCDFRISWIPVGGYVRMAGEIGENDDGPSEGSLARKSPLRRFFVYSAGVLMNFIIAFIIFPIVYFWGLPSLPPVVGYVTPGSPAWHARIVPGSIIKEINGVRIDSFDQIPIEVALAASPITLKLEEPAPDNPGEFRSRTLSIPSEYLEERGTPYLGIDNGNKTEIVTNAAGRRIVGFPVHVREGSAAFDAGARTGDVLIGLDDAPVDAHFMNMLVERANEPAGKQPKLHFLPGRESPPRTGTEIANITNPAGIAVVPRPVKDTQRPILGVYTARDCVKAVRDLKIFERLALKTGDRILQLNDRALVAPQNVSEAVAGSREIACVVKRGVQTLKLKTECNDQERAEFVEGLALNEGADPTTRVYVHRGSAAEKAGIESGDRILKIGDMPTPAWESVLKAVSGAKTPRVTVEIERESGDAVQHLTKTVELAETSSPDFGFTAIDDKFLLQATDLGEAMRLGFTASTRFIKQIILVLKKIALGQVSASKTVNGPILIAVTTYQVAHEGFVRLLFFLAIISLNLALINLLPIPLLDGGNIFFVVVEAIKGSPVSDRVIGASQTVGIFLLITLMVWVTFQDVRRVFFGIF